MSTPEERAARAAYMRRWRSTHQAEEAATRQRAKWREEKDRWRAKQSKKDTCQLCQQRRAVRTVTRLRITPEGKFQKVRVRYCGQC